MTTKRGSARWQGDIRSGTGQVSTESGALSQQPYGFNTRFEGVSGTNPEELIAAAHAACFSMALSKALGDAGVTDPVIETTSAVTLEKDEAGFTITRSALTSKVSAASSDEETIRAAADGAKSGCPVSKLLNAEVTLDLTIG